MEESHIRPEANHGKIPRHLFMLLIELYVQQCGMELVSVEFINEPESVAEIVGVDQVVRKTVRRLT